MGAAFLNCADATADGWQRRRIRSQPERRRGTSVAAGYGPGPARGGRRRSWYGSKKGITPHALKVQAAVLLHLIEPNRQKISPYHPMDPPLPSFSDGVRSEATSDCESGRPRMSIDLAPVCLPFVFGLCRPCSEHIGRSAHVAPASCASPPDFMLRTMAELFPASLSLASGTRRGCRAHTRASRQIVCGAYQTVVASLITPCRHRYRRDPHASGRRPGTGDRTHFWPAQVAVPQSLFWVPAANGPPEVRGVC